MPDLFPPGGAIDGSSLVKGRVDGSDGCQIDDGAITELFPGIGQDQQGLEQGVAAQPVQRGAQHCVDGAVHAEQILDDQSQHNPGQEVRQVNHRLNRLFQGPVLDLIEQNRKGDGHDGGKGDFAQGDDQGVAEQLKAVWHFEQVFEMFEAHKVRTEKTFGGSVVLKGHDDAEHRNKPGSIMPW